MTKKEFLKKISNGEQDILQQLIDLLNKMKIDYCVIEGLAVNAYVEPVVSLDLDIVVVTKSLNKLLAESQEIFTIEEFPHIINLQCSKSDLRIQIQKDSRYQNFIPNASTKDVMGYTMKVASKEDVLKGKIWAYSDDQRRASKRQKDLTDIFRLIETYPNLKTLLPETMMRKIKSF
jgi:hypothetical protein